MASKCMLSKDKNHICGVFSKEYIIFFLFSRSVERKKGKIGNGGSFSLPHSLKGKSVFLRSDLLNYYASQKKKNGGRMGTT